MRTVLTLHDKSRKEIVSWVINEPIEGSRFTIPSIIKWAGTERYFTVNPATVTGTPDTRWSADYYECDPPVVIGAL